METNKQKKPHTKPKNNTTNQIIMAIRKCENVSQNPSFGQKLLKLKLQTALSSLMWNHYHRAEDT